MNRTPCAFCRSNVHLKSKPCVGRRLCTAPANHVATAAPPSADASMCSRIAAICRCSCFCRSSWSVSVANTAAAGVPPPSIGPGSSATAAIDGRGGLVGCDEEPVLQSSGLAVCVFSCAKTRRCTSSFFCEGSNRVVLVKVAATSRVHDAQQGSLHARRSAGAAGAAGAAGVRVPGELWLPWAGAAAPGWGAPGWGELAPSGGVQCRSF